MIKDPKLSPQSYEMALQKMLIEVEGIANSPTSTRNHIDIAKRIYLNTLLAWGPTYAIIERFQLLSHYMRYGGGSMKDQIATDIFMRMQQTSKRYLKSIALALPKEQFEMWRHNMKEGGANKRKAPGMMMRGSSQNKRDSKGSLYDVSSLTSYLMERLPFSNSKNGEETMSNEVGIVLFEAVSDLHYIARNYREALKLLLIVGASLSGDEKINMLEENAVKSVISPEKANLETETSYEYIFAIMEYHNLHRYLLDESFVPQVDIGSNEPDPVPPIVALIRLVGLKLTGDFLVKYCTLPTFTELSKKSNASSTNEKKSSNDESSSYLPITTVSNQLQSRPKLLFWYLNLIFVHRQELYVNFPNTSVAPSVIIDLHRKHFDLFLNFSEEDETLPLGAEMKPEVDTQMISFMKVGKKDHM